MKIDGKPVEDDNRRFLNFADERARERMDGIIGRLYEAGFRYFKFDFNSDWFPGCDNMEGSPAHGGLLHVRGYTGWLRALRERYPDILIENCASGGMRMDYGILPYTDLVSISDQGEPDSLANLFYSVSRVVHPAQMGNWSLLHPQQSPSQMALSLVNSMLGRLTLGGEITRLKPAQMKLIQRAAALYKSYRSRLVQDPRVYHLTPDVGRYENDGILALEISCHGGRHLFLAVWRLNTPETSVSLRLRGVERQADYIVRAFPSGPEGRLSGKELAEEYTLTLPVKNSAVLLWLERETEDGR